MYQIQFIPNLNEYLVFTTFHFVVANTQMKKIFDINNV